MTSPKQIFVAIATATLACIVAGGSGAFGLTERLASHLTPRLRSERAPQPACCSRLTGIFILIGAYGVQRCSDSQR